MKKILSFALVLAMMLALAIPAMAADGLTFEITVAGTNPGGNPNLYKITIYEDGEEVASANFGNNAFNGSWGKDNFKINGTQTIIGTDGTVYSVSGNNGVTAIIVPPAAPYIIGYDIETVVKVTYDVSGFKFLANQKNEKGPNANYVTVIVTTETVTTTTTYAIWSNGDKTVYRVDVDTDITTATEGSGALANGSGTFSFEVTGGFIVSGSYNGNGNKFSYSID